jgi:PAS domain S-box-containing protein
LKKSPATRKKKGKRIAAMPSAYPLAELPDGLILFSLNKKYQYLSYSPAHAATMNKIWGVSIKPGDCMLDYISSKPDRAKAKKNFDKALRGKSFSVLEEYGDPTLVRAFYEDRYSPILNSRKQVVGLSVLVLDVTELKKNEQQYAESEQKLTLALRASQMGIWVWDIVENQLTWSEEVYKIFGLRHDTPITFESYQRLTHPDDWTTVLDKIETSIYTTADYQIEHRIFWPNGQVRWVEGVGNVVRDENGRPLRMTGMVRDITEKKQIEFERSEWKTRYELLTAATGDVVYDYDVPSGRIVWSGNLKQVLGFTPEEIDNIEYWTNLIHPADREQSVAELAIAEKNLSTYEVTYRFKNKAGHYLSIQDRGFFMADSQGKAARMLGSMRDVSENIRNEQEKRELQLSYQTLFNSTTDAIMIMHAEGENRGQIVSANPAAAAMHGYHLDEFLKLNIRDLDTPAEAEHLAQRLERVLRGEKLTFILEHRKKDGTIFPLEVTTGLVEVNGQRFVMAIDRDITERKKQEQALLDSEQRFRRLQEASFGGIVIHDNGVIIDANSGLATMSGYTLDELIGKNGLDIIAPEYRAIAIKNILTDYELPYDLEAIRKDGTRIFVEVQGKSIPFQGRRVRVSEYRDITQRKKAEQQIKEQNTRLTAIAQSLTRKNEQLEEFTQIVSHNLRSPAGNLVSLSQMMESASADELPEMIRLLQQASQSLVGSLNELNEILKIKQNKNIERQHLHFETELEHVRTMLIAQIGESNAVIQADFEAAPTIEFPKIYLESILLNLLSNALKYRHPARPPHIEIRSFIQGELVILTVKDNGLGIDLARHGHQVFKLHKTFHRHPESRGVGLFLVKNQIETMGGEINVTSTLGEGCTFTVAFTKNAEA